MNADDLAYLSVADALAAFRARKLSPVDVLRAQLARIDAHDKAINAFTLIDREKALAAAKASEARWQRGDPIGPLDGVTFTAKDNLMVAGYPFRRGSLVTPTAPVAETTPMVERVLEAGAVFVGLTTMPEFGAGPVTISPLTGITSNPWDVTKQAGGSTGGGAAGLAAGFSTFALGTDAGGSIRIPAALCGVVGMKGTGGRVPIYPAAATGGLSCHGPVTRTVDDTAMIFTLVARPDVRDASGLPYDGRDYRDGLEGGVKGWRIALSMTLGYAKKVDPEVADAIRAAAKRFESLGAIVEERDPGVQDPIDTYVALLTAGYRFSLRNLKPEQRELLSPALKEIMSAPEDPTMRDYLSALERCQGIARQYASFHATYDLLITPTVAVPAFARDRTYPEDFEAYPNRRAWTPFTSPFNLTQQPAITVPAGLTRSGLPIGLHIVGARGREAEVMRAARAFENASPFVARPRLQAN